MHVWNNVRWSIQFITWEVGNMLPSSTTKHYRPFGQRNPHRWTCDMVGQMNNALIVMIDQVTKDVHNILMLEVAQDGVHAWGIY